MTNHDIDTLVSVINSTKTARAKLHDALLHYEGGDITVPTTTPVYYLDLDHNGMYSPTDKAIYINTKLDKAQRIMTLVHEARHAHQDSIGLDMDISYYDTSGNLDTIKHFLCPLEVDARMYEITFINQFVNVLTEEEIASCDVPVFLINNYYN